MADSTLNAIRVKVRRLTRALSESQLSNTELDKYINTFVLYDFPEHLRLFNLKTTFSFYTEPYKDVYESSTDPNNVFYNFKNKYISSEQPVYIAGFQALFSEDRNQFFGIYPLLNSIASNGLSGNGTQTSFSGVVNQAQANIPPYLQNNTQGIILLKNNVLFSSVDVNSNGLSLIDFPISPSIGNLYVPGLTPTSTTVQDTANYINYLTGQFVITFPTAPKTGFAINSQTIPVQPSRPQSMLFYDGKITMRPVPDQPYKVNFEVYVQPTEFLESNGGINQEPDLSEWWQYIAYGTAKKIFEDRMDMESVQSIMPEFKKQEMLIQRRTIVQYTSQRTSTIYSQDLGSAGAYGPGFWSGGGQ